MIRALIWGCATLIVVAPVAFILLYVSPFRGGESVRAPEAVLYSPFIGIVAAILVAVWKKQTQEEGFMPIGGLFGSGGPDSLIDELLKLSHSYSMSEGVKRIYDEFVPKHIAQLDARFFERFVERITEASSIGEKSRLTNLMSVVLGGLVTVCQGPIHELSKMTDRHDLTEKDVESYLKTAEKRFHFALYPTVVLTFSQLYQAWEALHAPYQDWEGPILKMVVRVALRLRPEAKKVAALMAATRPE